MGYNDAWQSLFWVWLVNLLRESIYQISSGLVAYEEYILPSSYAFSFFLHEISSSIISNIIFYFLKNGTLLLLLFRLMSIHIDLITILTFYTMHMIIIKILIIHNADSWATNTKNYYNRFES